MEVVGRLLDTALNGFASLLGAICMLCFVGSGVFMLLGFQNGKDYNKTIGRLLLLGFILLCLAALIGQ